MRQDIQILRGLAVLLVMLHHAQTFPAASGYLGVDVFFVISGFLVTGMVRSAVDTGRFSLGSFYFRRAKRLLPAAYVTFVATAAAAPYLLSQVEYNEFTRQLIGAVTFTANIALLLQADYFNAAAELKPLLHVWSLSIEEQYYVILPALLLLTPRRHWARLMAVLAVSSFVLCLAVVGWKPVAAFYLLPTRAWEMALGSTLAVAGSAQVWRVWSTRLFVPAAGALLVLPWWATGWAHPGWAALLVCLATMVVITARNPWLERTRSLRWLAIVGDWSYSLYLVHWPIFALLSNATIGASSQATRWAALAIAFVLGYLLHRFVERPVWRHEFAARAPFVAGLVAASALILTLPVALAPAVDRKAPDFAVVRRANAGFSAECQYGDVFVPKPACANAQRPRVMVWGDSHAMHLVAGVAAATDRGVVQATRSLCGPFIGLAPVGSATTPRHWAESCLRFNRSVLAYLKREDSIDTVVMSSVFAPYLESDDPSFAGRRVLVDEAGTQVERDRNAELAIEHLRDTVSAVAALGKRVIVVAPPPRSDFNIGLCQERRHTRRFSLGDHADCTVPRLEYEARQASVIAFVARLRRELAVPVHSFDALLCDARVCQTEIGTTLLYADEGHLSYDGSRLLVPRLGLFGGPP